MTSIINILFAGVIFIFFQTTHGLTGQWRLIKYKDLKTKQEVSQPANVKRSVVLTFKDNGYEGFVNGHTAKNNINGHYYLQKDNVIHFPTVGQMTDEKGEKEWGDNLPRILLDASSYSLKNDTLVIKYDKNSKAMVFIKGYEESFIDEGIFE